MPTLRPASPRPCRPPSRRRRTATACASPFRPGAIVLFEQDRDLRYTWACNPPGGLAAADVLGKRDADLVADPDEAAAKVALKREVLRTGQRVQRDLALTFGDEPTRWFTYTVVPRRDPGGEIVGVLCVAVDVTAAHRRMEALEHALAEAEAARDEAETARDEVEAARDEAEAARDEAEVACVAVERKTNFVAEASHALRSPLTAVLGLAQLLPTDAEQAEVVERLRDATSDLRGLTDDLLDFSKLESGGADLTTEDVDLVDLVRDVGASFTAQAAAKDLALRIDLPPASVWVRADANALRRVVTNFVSNAIKYTDAGHVLLRVPPPADADTTAAVVVTDTGRGMTDAFVARLFEPFTQAGGEGLTDSGTGLGMAITKRLVALMDGAIDIATAPGEGTTFTATFPRAARA